MKVIDSSSIAKLVNREQNWERVEEALSGGCVSLDLAVKETGNSLWVRVHRRLLDDKHARRFFSEFVAARPFVIEGQELLYDSAMEIALTLDITIYDAIFLALAKKKGYPFVTSDPSQAEAAKKLGVVVDLIP